MYGLMLLLPGKEGRLPTSGELRAAGFAVSAAVEAPPKAGEPKPRSLPSPARPRVPERKQE